MTIQKAVIARVKMCETDLDRITNNANKLYYNMFIYVSDDY